MSDDLETQTHEGLEQVRAIMAAPEDIHLHPALTNVTRLRADRDRLKPRAKSLLSHATWAAEIEPQLERSYLVKGWLDRASVSVVYGPSNVGKSFLALDLAHHVSKGLDWGGRRVNRGRVLYVAAEGGSNFRNRVAALQDPEFWVLSCPLTLTGKDSAAAPLAEMMQHLADTAGQPFDLIVIDTLARVMGGGDENTAPDIADLVRNLDLVRRATGAHVMLIHHTGKDTGRGARGHSSLRAAIDTEIELTRDDLGEITAEVLKQRDGPTGYKFVYSLRQVELGCDQDGDPVTTCVVNPAIPAEAGRAGLWESSIKASKILDQLIASVGEVVRKPNLPGSPSVPLVEWVEACVADEAVSSSGSDANRRRQFHRCKDQLVDAKMVLVRDDRVWKVQA